MDEETRTLLEQVKTGDVYAVMWYDPGTGDDKYEIFDTGRFTDGKRDAENFAESIRQKNHRRVWIGRITGVLNP